MSTGVAVVAVRHLTAALVFDPVDTFARTRSGPASRPRPLGSIRFMLVAEQVGGVRQDFPSPLELQVRGNDAGYGVWFGRVRRPNGTIVSATPPGTYVVRAESAYYQTQEVLVDVPTPAPAFPLELQPGYAYPFPAGGTSPRASGPTLLRGVLQGPDGTGIAGATVEVTPPTVPPTPVFRTDVSGQWVLVFPETQPAGNVTIRFTFSDGTVTDVAAVAIVPGQQSALGSTAFRGFVTSAGIPVEGATITVTGAPGSARSRRDGGWQYVFPLNQAPVNADVTALLPDGRSQPELNQPVQPRATVVVPSFRFV